MHSEKDNRDQLGFAAFLRSDRRLLLLRLLAGQGDFCLNDSLLLQGLDQMGHGVDRDTIQADLCFLQEQNLIEIITLSPQLQRVRLLNIGLEVARGKRPQAQVRRPLPNEIDQDTDNHG